MSVYFVEIKKYDSLTDQNLEEIKEWKVSREEYGRAIVALTKLFGRPPR